jgi:hypothetical protein
MATKALTIKYRPKFVIILIGGEVMYGYVYITTNLINNKIYIGQHKSETFDSEYIGKFLMIQRKSCQMPIGVRN